MDYRDNARDRKNLHDCVVYTEDDEETVLPSKYEVCPTCGGRGSYVNPSIDSHGITAEEWDTWDDEEREGYFAGYYDITCEECEGLRVVRVPDWEKLTDDQKRLWQEREECFYGMAREREMGY